MKSAPVAVVAAAAMQPLGSFLCVLQLIIIIIIIVIHHCDHHRHHRRHHLHHHRCHTSHERVREVAGSKLQVGGVFYMFTASAYKCAEVAHKLRAATDKLTALIS